MTKQFKKISGFKVEKEAYFELINKHNATNFVHSLLENNPHTNQNYAKYRGFYIDLEESSKGLHPEQLVSSALRTFALSEINPLITDEKTQLGFVGSSGILDEIMQSTFGAQISDIKKAMGVANFEGFVWNKATHRYENGSFWIDISEQKPGDYAEDKLYWGEI